MEHTRYIGDGVYVAVTPNGMVKLMTGSHDRPDNTVYLEPEVFNTLMAWHLMAFAKPEEPSDD